MTTRRLVPLSSFLALVACNSGRPPSAQDGGAEADGGTADRTVCLPQAVSRASTLAPDLLERALDAEASDCHLATRTTSGDAASFPTPLEEVPAPGVETCDAGECWVTMPAFAYRWDLPLEPGSWSSAWTSHFVGLARPARNPDTGEVRIALDFMEHSSSALRRLERTYDRAGHLLSERERWDGNVWFQIENQLDGDALVASTYTDSINGAGVITYEWSYDSRGRLTSGSAMVSVAEDASGVAWQYDDQGRPERVERSLGGTVWIAESWEYAGDRPSRHVTVLSETPAIDVHYLYPGGLDDHHPLLQASDQREWDAAGFTADAGCDRLPHSVTYGYPEADRAYALGWPVGDRPHGIDADYGFGPAFDTGIDRWYGHDRVEGAGTVRPLQGDLEISTEYDPDGTMVRESVVTAAGLTSEQTQSFENGQVTRDERVVEMGEERLTSVLALGRSPDGLITRRSLHLNGVLVAEHDWTWDDEGRLTRHRIAHHELIDAVESLVPTNLANLPPALPPPVVHERGYSADGWTTTAKREGVVTSRVVRDADGRIVKETAAWGAVTTHAYGADGPLVWTRTDDDGNGSPDRFLEYDIDADGKVLARRLGYGAVSSEDILTWECRR